MVIDLGEVLRNFLLISDLEENESIEYMPVLKEAINAITAKLKNKNIKKEDKVRLNYAAANLAFYKYMLIKKAKLKVDSFSVDGVNIKNDINSSLKAAEDIWLSAKEEIQDLLKDDEFDFIGVPTCKYCC